MLTLVDTDMLGEVQDLVNEVLRETRPQVEVGTEEEYLTDEDYDAGRPSSYRLELGAPHRVDLYNAALDLNDALLDKLGLAFVMGRVEAYPPGYKGWKVDITLHGLRR